MPQDSEHEVRLQFLEEAQEHLNIVESDLMGLGTQGVNRQALDGILRAAHSVKGGAAMMGFETLSHLAHRMEDFFKVLKVGKPDVTDGDLERSLLLGVDQMRQVIAFNRQEQPVEESWLATHVTPIFDGLHNRLGDPQPEDEASLLGDEEGADMTVLLFESEVEGVLQRLEEICTQPGQPCLVEETVIAAQELGGLAEMLDLPAFNSLCESVLNHLETGETADQAMEVAQLAIQTWRQAQAMVIVGQAAALPTALDLSDSSAHAMEASDRGQAETLISDQDLANISDALELETTSLDVTAELTTVAEYPDSLALEAIPQDALDEVAAIAEPAATLTSVELDDSLATVAEQTESLVSESAEPLTDTEALPAAVGEEVLELFSSLENDSATVIPQQEHSSEASVEPVKADAPAEHVTNSTIRVSVDQLNQLSELFGELIIERNSLQLQLQQLRALMSLLNQRTQNLEQSNSQLRSAYDKVATRVIMSSQVPALVTAGGSQSGSPSHQSGHGTSSDVLQTFPGAANFGSTFDLLEMDRYSELHLLSQEMMETAVQIQEVSDDINTHLEEAEQTTQDLTRTSKQLQTSVSQVRMRPISALVDRFPRMLRDLSLQHGKDVELRIIGGSTLIDRTVLEALNDPLVHLLRNAFDHGIETPDARTVSGKNPKGTIEISAAHRGNQTIITVRDDGRGIKLDGIKERALSLGLDQEILSAANEQELLDLIFEPGFSTAKQVTDLSGRGVGMDVVRTNLGQVGGSVTLKTKAGEGTTFTISVPLMRSVVRILLVESNNTFFAFPATAVEEVTLLQSDQVLPHVDHGRFQWHDSLVPLIDLTQWLQFPHMPRMLDIEAAPMISTPTVLMVSHGGEKVAIAVDRYWDEQEVTIRQVEGDLPLPTGFAGCAILGDGHIAPLVDVPDLLGWIEEQRSPTSPNVELKNQAVQSLSKLKNKQPSAPTSGQPMVMVVDDSVNVRRFLALTLEKAGYHVEQAKDGQHALDKLKSDLPVQAVICDVEMPRLDGFGFLARVQSNPDYKAIPVCMLTSRSGDKHRKLAMQLGATAYFSKTL